MLATNQKNEISIGNSGEDLVRTGGMVDVVAIINAIVCGVVEAGLSLKESEVEDMLSSKFGKASGIFSTSPQQGGCLLIYAGRIIE